MVAAITDAQTGAFLGAHRTFLDSPSAMKAAVKPDRMILGAKRGGVVRLVDDFEIESRLAFAEGIETALTAISAGWPCWSAIDAGNLARMPLWPWIDLTVFVDNDTAGIDAAETLVSRWVQAGGNAVSIKAPLPGDDWNDVALRLAGAR
jgi:hypothetical protein